MGSPSLSNPEGGRRWPDEALDLAKCASSPETRARNMHASKTQPKTISTLEFKFVSIMTFPGEAGKMSRTKGYRQD
jgi:hypothetical protein